MTPPEIDLSKIKDANVPIAIVVGKHDKLQTVNDAHRLLATLNGYLGKFPVVLFSEIDGGQETFMVGKDMSYFRVDIMDKIRLHNPIPTPIPSKDLIGDEPKFSVSDILNQVGTNSTISLN